MTWDRVASFLMFVTDGSLAAALPTGPRAVAAFDASVEAAVAAGATHVQIRERDVSAKALGQAVARVVERWGSRARMIVNDRLDVALDAGAAGVHLRADGPRASRVRAMTPRGFLIGRSVHSLDEARDHQDADFLVFGPVFETASHPGVPGQGAARLRAVCEAVRVPVIAIGGITAGRASQCLDAGAAGVAAIRAFLPTV